MRISVTDQYALRVIFDLATQPPGMNVKLRDISRRQDVSPKALEAILPRLKQGGFVESRRGVDGGFHLVRPADEITIGAVMRFMGGAKTVTREPKPQVFTDLWGRVDAAVGEVIDRINFGEVVLRWRELQSRHVASWEI